MDRESRVLITGANGMVGTALKSLLEKEGHAHVAGLGGPTARDNPCDLAIAENVDAAFARLKPEYVFHTAARVYGLGGNMSDQNGAYVTNIFINTPVVNACLKYGVKKIVAVGTGAVYASMDGDFNEANIFDGEVHWSEYGYATAKRAMLAHLKICKEQFGLDYAFVMPSNLFGPHDTFNLEKSHVIPTLIRKFYEHKTQGKPLVIWGTGTPKRDFFYIEDAAAALYLMMQKVSGPINMGSGEVMSIRSVVECLARHVGVNANDIQWDASKPDGHPIRSYNLSQLYQTYGFQKNWSAEKALTKTYDWYAANSKAARV